MYAFIKNGKVDNTIICTANQAASLGAVLIPDDSNIGDDWNGTVLVKPKIAAGKLLNIAQNYIQSRLDTFAKTRDYDSILSAISYIHSANAQWVSEATYCIAIRDSTWTALYSVIAQVQAGTITLPRSISEFEQYLPAYAWPN